MARLGRSFAGLGLVLGLVGCGPDFDRVSELRTLRVMAVQKNDGRDPPSAYVQPGQEVSLTMLWHDAAEQLDPTAPRPIQRTWISGCFNPLGDQYLGCFGTFDGVAGLAGGDPDALTPLLNQPEGMRVCLPAGDGEPDTTCIGSGDTFRFNLPSTLISERPPPPDPTQARYGLSYVFFAVCAGTVELLPITRGNAFPLACRGDDGELLGADDFVAGYTAVYSYDTFENANAAIMGFEFEGVEAPSCVGGDCLAVPVNRTDCMPDAPTVPLCTRGDLEDCPGHDMKPLVDPSVAEVDEVTASLRDGTYTEQMWINYYVDRGGVKSDVRLLNDATAGFNADYGTEFRAPKEQGPATVWAAVHDNRGGVNWVRSEVCVVEP